MSIGRRTFLAGSAAVAASGMTSAQAQHNVPNSTGSEAPKLKAPANACDCHMHIYDGERFPPARPGPQSRMQSNATVADYRLLQKRNGTTRTVIVTPAAYVTDNRVTLDGIQQTRRREHAWRRGGASDRDRCGTEDARRRRHPRHPFHGVRSALRRRLDRHDRALVETHRRSRLAHPDPHACRPDRGECGDCSRACRRRSCSIISAACRNRRRWSTPPSA